MRQKARAVAGFPNSRPEHQPGYHLRNPQQQLEDRQHYERLNFERQQDEQLKSLMNQELNQQTQHASSTMGILQELDSNSKLMHEKGILYIPDFLVNRMGIVNCADEHMGVIDNDPNLDLHLGSEWENSIFRLTLNVLAQSKSAQRTMQEIAVEMANRRSLEVNPIYGHRSLKIIDFVTDKWDQ
jgi:hypothetical protein